MKVKFGGFEFGRLELVVCSALAVAHAAFCLYDSTHDEWGVFLTFLIDLPISVPVLTIWHGSPASFLIVGTLWWFFLGFFISMLMRGFYELIVRLAKGSAPSSH